MSKLTSGPAPSKSQPTFQIHLTQSSLPAKVLPQLCSKTLLSLWSPFPKGKASLLGNSPYFFKVCVKSHFLPMLGSSHIQHLWSPLNPSTLYLYHYLPTSSVNPCGQLHFHISLLGLGVFGEESRVAFGKTTLVVVSWMSWVEVGARRKPVSGHLQGQHTRCWGKSRDH